VAGLGPAIHVLLALRGKKDVDARDIGERSDAVLRTAMRAHDGGVVASYTATAVAS
jgi:hypothetical protein